LDYTDPSERAGRNCCDAYRLVDILLEATVENMLQEAGTAVIVLWRYDDESVRPLHLLGKVGILDSLSRVIGRKRELGNVNELGLKGGTLA